MKEFLASRGVAVGVLLVLGIASVLVSVFLFIAGYLWLAVLFIATDCLAFGLTQLYQRWLKRTAG